MSLAEYRSCSCEYGMRQCQQCEGSGTVPCLECVGMGWIVVEGVITYCLECEGTGVVECEACESTGEVPCPDCTGSEYGRIEG